MEQVVNWVVDQSLFATISFISNGKKTILLSPVTKVVHRNGFPAISIIDIANETANDGRSQVTGVEWFCNVGRRVLNDDSFTFSRVVSTIVFLLLRDNVEDVLVQLCSVDLEVEEDSFR